MQGPGYALSQFLAEHGADVTILGTTYRNGGGIDSEHIAVTLPDGTQLGMDVHFAADDDDSAAARPVKCPACGTDTTQVGDKIADHATKGGTRCVASGWIFQGGQWHEGH